MSADDYGGPKSVAKVKASRLAHAPPCLLSCDPDHRLGTWGPVFFVVWKGEVKPRTAEVLAIRLRAFAHGLPGRSAALFTVVEEGAPMPSAPARTALANILRFCADELVASAVAMEGDGFRASAVRSVATGLAILARQPFPHRMFPNITTGSNWLEKELRASGLPGTAADVAYAVNEIRGDGAFSLPSGASRTG